MVFSSVLFIFAFLPALMAIYFLVPKKFRRLRNGILLVFSLGFYAYGEPKYVVIMILSIFINYVFGYFVHAVKSKEAQHGFADYKPSFKLKFILWAAIVCNIGILMYFKYTNFFLQNISGMLGMEFTALKIIMPIGISFFTFQGLSYVLDIYMNKAKIQRNPLNVALYVSLFPQLIAGPIVRYETVAEEIVQRDENLTEAAEGIRRFILGLGKKMLIANSMGLIADTVFAIKTAEMATSLAWIGAIAYTFQIYFDFSGYSDMAIGLGKVFGFHFLENFNYPYISKSITEFWRRWHISLSTWFRDYVYIPLGGNRVSPAKQLRNIMIVWLLTGFWHGAAWNFIAWGLYFGVILIFEKNILGKVLNKLWSPVQHFYALVLIVIGWVLFRAPNMQYAVQYIKVMLGLSGTGLSDYQSLYLILEYKVELVLAVIASIPVKDFASNFLETRKNKKMSDMVNYNGQNIFAILVFCLSVIYLINSTFNPFIYFRF